MARFSTPYQSHEHSLKTLSLLRQYDQFFENLSSVADMGCGAGHDIHWWATQEDLSYDPPVPFNFNCYAVDRSLKNIQAVMPENVHTVEADFENRVVLPKPVDFIWCHDAFQYCVNPLNTLKLFNQQLNENGMLYICVPVNRYLEFGRVTKRTANYEYFEYTMPNLVYMLAVNGFDCRDAYFLKESGDTWLQAAVYKTGIEPMDPRETSWYTLSEHNLLNDSMKESLNKYGYVKEDDLIFGWLDKDWHYSRD